MYAVKLNQFEGPLDLLLSLIEKRKMSVNDVSLSEISEKYMEYLKQLSDFPLEEAAGFAVVASTLMLIKSKSLMPSLELNEEEEQSIAELENRLKIYREIRRLSFHIKDRFNKNPLFGREPFKGVKAGFIEPKSLTMEIILSAVKSIIERLPKPEKLHEVAVKKIVSLEEKIIELTERVRTKLEISFSELSLKDGKNIKIEIIVNFLAMLELAKQGIIMVSQSDSFGNIQMKKNEY